MIIFETPVIVIGIANDFYPPPPKEDVRQTPEMCGYLFTVRLGLKRNYRE